MGQQPPLDRRGLVGGGVVDDDVHVQLGGHRAVDRGQEPAELSRPVTAVGLVHDLAGGHLQGGEQAGSAVAEVIVGAPLGQPRPQRQDWPGAVHGLHAGLVVHAQHHR
jgi:hypothetical protein